VVDAVDFEAIKQVQQRVWSEGDFAAIGTHQVLVGERLCERLDVFPDERVLDVACGSGNASLAAARRAWGNTTGLDYVPELLARGRERAAAEGLEVDFVEGDAERLPFEDASFDVVTSTFGAMFAPNQQRAADELLRVCRPGGRIGMANWTPEGYVGAMFSTVSEHAPPPPGVDPPSLWGTKERLRELFGERISGLRANRQTQTYRYRSFEHFLEFFRTYFGPMKVAFERVGPDGADDLVTDLRALVARFDRGGERAMIVDAEYLEVVAVRA
jgi:ubiquinone/menaquinone biosynthesis C-methylase UbiE